MVFALVSMSVEFWITLKTYLKGAPFYNALQMALHADLFGVRLFREPDAGNPPVRFDEREQETESSQPGLRRRGESLVNRHREAKATAPYSYSGSEI
jgi:hypothetical protein